MSLADRASTLANGAAPNEDGHRGLPPTADELRNAAGADPVGGLEPEALPDIDIGDPGPNGPDQVPVHVAWQRLMVDVYHIAKGDIYKDRKGVTQYNFRGHDRTVNAFAPAVRKHGITLYSVGVRSEYKELRSSGGTAMHQCTVTVKWLIIGPMGDQMPMLGESSGEGIDVSDKATAKAQTVAHRVFLLMSAMVATGDPDPDSSHLERGGTEVASPIEYRDEILDERTSRPRMMQIKHDLGQHRLLGHVVINERGEDEPLGRLLERTDAERLARFRAGQAQVPGGAGGTPA